MVFRSLDGMTWETVNLPGREPAEAAGLKFLHDRFLARVASTWKQSRDGVVWSDFPLPLDVAVHDVTYARDRWVCVGAGGLFASARVPGEWAVNRWALTAADVSHVVALGGWFHAYSRWSGGMQAFSSGDGLAWTIQPEDRGVWFDHLECGQREAEGGTVENVMVGTLSGGACHVGKAKGGRVVWETHRREGVFGRLIHRRTADAGSAGLVRREWVGLVHGPAARRGLPVYSLRASGESPALEDPGTLHGILALASGPGAMIAVGTGGVIRRYSTRALAGL